MVGATAADADPGAAAAVEGHEGGLGDGAPTGPAGGSPGTAPSRPKEMKYNGAPYATGGHRGGVGDDGDVVPDVGWRRQRRWWPTGRRRGDRGEEAAPLNGSGHPWSVPDPPLPARRPHGRPDWRAREGAGAPERARQATADRAPRGGCSALFVGQFLPLVCNDPLGGLDMHGGNYLHWFVTARVNSHLGKLGPGDGFRPLRTKGDDGGRHRRRRQVNHVSMSRRFDRPDFPDLESHSGCRASG